MRKQNGTKKDLRLLIIFRWEKFKSVYTVRTYYLYTCTFGTLIWRPYAHRHPHLYFGTVHLMRNKTINVN